MFAKCFPMVSSRVPCFVSEFFYSRLKVGIVETARLYGKDLQNGHSVSGQTLRNAGPKLSWPRHPHHRLPSAWPYSVTMMTPAQARNVVAQLDDNGRALILEQLKRFEEEKAAIAGDTGDVPPNVTTSQLFNIFMFYGFPFIGFGILDNGIMILAGEYIDITIGAALGISTMAAAALGNLISDVAGVGSAGYIETLVSKIGIRTPDITPAQSDLKVVRWATGLGRAIGISLGCLIGMLPLLFFKKKDASENESESEPASAHSR